MRLFLAINLPDELKKQLFEMAQPLKDFGKLKLVEEGNIHLTLKFLGEVKESEVSDLTEDLRSVKFESFPVTLRGVGVFPNKNYIRVVWVGCGKGSEEIITLHNGLETALRGFKKDRDFHPHATIARVKFPEDTHGLIKFIEENSSKEFGKSKAESFDLMKSELGSEGPKYGVVESFP
jgi:2'-5' RNA ligase